MRSAPRFAGVDRGAGHYESYFIKATRPGGGQGIWIRHTVHKRPDADPTAALWLTVFDAEAPGPRAAKASFEAAELSAPEGSYIRIDGAQLDPGHATGEIEAGDSRRAGTCASPTRASPSTTCRTTACTTRRCHAPSSSPPIRARASTAG